MTDKKAAGVKHPKAEEKKLTEDQQKVLELTDHLKRIAAEFDNYKKRAEKEACLRQKYANELLVQKIIPVVDNLERALKNTENKDELVKGVCMILDQLKEILHHENVERIETVGKEFDPNLHEALMREDSEKDNMVLEEFEAGYTMAGRVIKHSKVKVGINDRKEDKKEGA